MRWPKHIQAEPTLRGLRLVVKDADRDPPEVRFYPWTQVQIQISQTIQSVWAAYDNDGQMVRHDGRQLYLDVAGRRATSLARRAHRRALKQAVRRPDFRLIEEYPRPERVGFALFLLLCVACVGGAMYVALPGILRGLHEVSDPSAPASYRILLWTIRVAFPLLTMVMAAVAFWIMLPLVRRNVARATVNRRGIRAELWDGGEVEQAWEDLHFSDPTAVNRRLSFVDGTTLWLPPRCRARTIVAMLQQDLHPAELARARRQFKMAIIRISLYALAATIAAGLLGEHLHRQYGSPRSGWETAGLLALAAGAMAILALMAYLSDGKCKWAAKWKRLVCLASHNRTGQS